MPATVPYRVADEPVPGYRLLEFLGRGGFGEVWKAVGPGGIQIAIKFIRLDEVAGRKELRALRLVKRLRHPNLVPIIAYWLKAEDGTVLDDDTVTAITGASPAADTARWSLTPGGDTPRPLDPPSELIIAMGLGETNLQQRLRERQREGAYGLPEEELFAHLFDAARAIDYLNRPIHDLGAGPVAIQHCDIKPQNMLVVGGALQLCDFGLASMLGDVRTTSTAAGTIAYAAPECFRDGKPSFATDQYSLAVTYYELKTGSLPYDAGSMAQVSQAILQGQLDFSRVSLAEQQVLRRATALDPRKRFQTTTDMVEALRQAVPSERLTTVTRKLSSSAPRRRARWALAAGLAAAALAIGLFVWRAPWAEEIDASAAQAKRESMAVAGTPALSDATAKTSPRQAARPGTADENTGVSAAPETSPAALPPEITNSLAMKLALVPAGEFAMGSSETAAELADALGPLPEGFDDADEHPEHRVRIGRPFYFGVTEVTVGQFRRFAAATGYQTDSQRDPNGGWGYDAQAKTAINGPQFDWRNPGFAQHDQSPVVNVSWNDARAFCDWLSQAETRRYRLPTEAEWEYACRAGTTTHFYSGDSVNDLQRVANLLDQSAHEALPAVKNSGDNADHWAFTAPVASLTSNQFGLFDMHGNVAEWCGDWYGKQYYADSPADDPPRGPDEGQYRVLRGGSWIHPAVRCRSAYRGFDAPNFRSGYVGFRIVCEAELDEDGTRRPNPNNIKSVE